MGKQEKIVEDYFIKRCVDAGGFCRKYTSPGRRGVPDRIGFLPKLGAVFVELKTNKGELSTAQRRELERMTDMGVPCAVLNSRIEIDAFFYNYERGLKYAAAQSNELQGLGPTEIQPELLRRNKV